MPDIQGAASWIRNGMQRFYLLCPTEEPVHGSVELIGAVQGLSNKLLPKRTQVQASDCCVPFGKLRIFRRTSGISIS